MLKMKFSRFRCPNPRCQVILSIPNEMHGKPVHCAGCGEVFVVPPSNLNRRRNASRRRGRGKDYRAAA